MMDIPGLKAPNSIAEMVDRQAFREMCEQFTGLYGVGIHVVDIDGRKLADIRANTASFYEYLLSIHSLKVLYTQLIGELKSVPLSSSEDRPVISSFSGLRYRILPLCHEGAVLGRIIFGPYRPKSADSSASKFVESVSDEERAKLVQLQENIPEISEAVVSRVLQSMGSLVDIIIHNSYKAYLTSQMHLATMTAAFEDLEKKNQELRQANQELRQLDKLKSNFISTVSHELRTPLTSIIGYAEMLLEGLAGEMTGDQTNYVGTILEKGESLLDLIRQVLDLSRIESGKLILKRERVDPKEILDKCISDVLPQANKRSLDIQIKLSPDVVPIFLDPDKIRRVIVNLLGNAVKFSNEGGTIVLDAQVHESLPVGEDTFDVFEPDRNRYLSIAVIDRGIGIPPDSLERVFDTFFQVDNSSTREFGGTGLGLAIVRNFVDEHQGKLTVESELGQGTTFTVLFPYAGSSDSPGH